MILAAGVGSRLDPITRTTPKPMVPVVGLPVIEHIIRLLEQHGFDDIICNTHYLPDQIEDYFAAKTDLKAKVSFNREEKLLGTAGGWFFVHSGWPGVVAFVGGLYGIALAVALHLARLPPLRA